MSDISEKVSKLESRILRNRQQIKRLKEADRKKQTRTKIELGGLVFTAELHPHLPDLLDRDGEARAIVLGVLATATEHINDAAFRKEMLSKGRRIFASKERTKRRYLKLQKQERIEK